MSANDKHRYPREAALPVARELCDLQKPVTSQLIVAGSLRRRKPTVGDIEILFVPRSEDRPFDLLSSRPVNLAEELLDDLLTRGILAKRLNVQGRCAWGAQNKLAVHVANGIPVDLFTATEENWWNYLVCRTGPGESNVRIAEAAQRMGWKWHPYGSGFDRGGDMTGRPYEERIMHSEREVFEFVGLPYHEPHERK